MRLLLILVLVIALGVYGIVALLTVDRRSDESQIKSLVADAVEAANRRDLGGIVRFISPAYKDETGLNRDRLRMLIAQALRSEAPYIASAHVHSQIVGRDTAEISLRATVKSAGDRLVYDRYIVLALRREAGKHAFIIPVKVWRIVEIKYHGLDMEF